MYDIILSVPEIKHVLSKTKFYYDGNGVVSDDVLDTFISEVRGKMYDEYEFCTYSDEDLPYHAIVDSGGDYYPNISRDSALEVYVRRTIKEMANWTLCNKYHGGFDDGRHTGQAIHEGEI